MSGLTLLLGCLLVMITTVSIGIAVAAMAPLVYVPRLAQLLSACRCTPIAGRSMSAHGEDCEFVNSDGLTLRGTYLRTEASVRRGVVLFAHEAGGDRWSVNHYLDALRGAGFDVFAFDFRCHGTSDSPALHVLRPWVTQAEVQDVRAAVDYLCSRKDADPRGVVVMGRSRGGVAALCAAASDQRIISVVADSCFAHESLLPHLIRRYAYKYVPYPRIYDFLPDVLLWWYAKLALARVVGRSHANSISLRRRFQQLRQPVLLIHGERDAWVPTHVAQSVADTLRRCTFWLVPGGRHNNSVQIAPSEYALRVTRFLFAQLQCSSAS
jgi:pimeloyl-ACP methyl ester carboxylesterase